MGAALELLTAVLVLVDGTQDRDDLGLGGQGDGAGDLGIGALGGLGRMPMWRLRPALPMWTLAWSMLPT